MIRKMMAPLLALACCLPGAAEATWRKAESTHFIVYSEQDEASIRRAALRLEKLNLLQHVVTGMEKDKPALKVKVFVLRGFYDVQQTMPFPKDGVAGYYDANVRGPYSVISRESDNNHDFSSQLVLYHELTHHFMFQYYNVAYPPWYVEGFAEFIGASKLDDSNEAILGQQSLNRYYTFKYQSWTPVREILAARSYEDMGQDLGALYAEGWLLTHYLELGGKRDGQLAKYLADINAGKSFEDAARDAFGDINKLNSELIAYSRKSALPATGITFKPQSIPPVTVEELPADRAAMVMDDLRLFAGVPMRDAREFAAKVRADAAKGGETAWTLRLRAEADRIANDHDDYVATVARWNQIAPDDPEAMMHKSLVAMDALAAAKSTDAAAWTAARRTMVAAARKAPDDAIILKAYFNSFGMQGIPPTADAHNALYKALDLVPADVEVRYQLAASFEAHGDIKDAIAVIRLAAFTEKDNLTPKEKAERDRDEQRYRLAGSFKHETPRDMLNRLLKKQAEQAAGGTPAG
ncbi:MAG: hypothetical protein JWN66_1489 [Sphingomonas bacterium]|uniref:hypothetical protein n=1 Tax=Sphingomonas bacterium TaxID=1895847 RepID=UPI0026380AD1|nr:hypothetical protein [Sphingomonas bacterium]MDB5704373.1 hypothetical protein [Sphingomonas bacterium]